VTGITITPAQLEAGLGALASTPWADILKAVQDNGLNIGADAVALEDILSILAAFGVPFAGLAAEGLMVVQVIALLAPALPADTSPPSPYPTDQDPLSRAGRRST
jgi:hypothetical protein